MNTNVNFEALLDSLSHMLINFGEHKDYPSEIAKKGKEFCLCFNPKYDWDACDWYLHNYLSNEMLINMREYNCNGTEAVRYCVDHIMDNFKLLTRPVEATYTEEAMEEARQNAYKLSFECFKEALQKGVDRIEIGDMIELNGTEIVLTKNWGKNFYQDVCDIANDLISDREG